MDEAPGSSSSSSLPPFLSKTHEMVEDSSTDSIVSWSSSGKSFVVWNPPEFARVLLPKFFKHSNFSSFIRQLNTYGFRKVDPEQWEFANEDFIRGQLHLLKNIHRRKPVHSHSTQNLQGQGSSQLTESEKQSLKDEIEKLQRNREQLVLELQRYENERQALHVLKRSLKDCFQNAEQRHQSIVSILTQALVKHGLSVNVIPELESHVRKRRVPKVGNLFDGARIEGSPTGSSESLSGENKDENPTSDSEPSVTLDQVDQLDSSLSFWEEIVHGFSKKSNDISSSVELDIEIRIKSPGIDVNSEPASVATETAASKEEETGPTGPVAPTPTGVNDVFWEQFLTENPGSSEAQEVQSERKDSERRSESNFGDRGKFWWSARNVNNLTERMGHLTPAEKTR